MKNTIKLAGFILIGLMLTSCGETSASSASSSAASSVSSISSVSDEEKYMAYLKNQDKFYVIGSDITIKKGGETYYYESLRKAIYVGSGDNAGTIVLHVNGSRTQIADLSLNTSATNETINYYKIPGATYTINESGTFTMTEETNDNLVPFTVDYDFGSSAVASVAIANHYASLKATVSSDKLNAFIGDDSLSGVSDFAYTATMQQIGGLLTGLNIAYTKNGYSVSQVYTYSIVNSSISLPVAS